MTEAEKTEIAILKAKAEQQNKLRRAGTAVPEKVEVVEKIEEKVEVAEVAEAVEFKSEKLPDIKNYPFEVRLGKEKIVRFKPWTGKTRKKFTKLFKDVKSMDDVDLKQVIQVLITDNIENKDTYISDTEQQYLLTLLRKESIDDKFSFDGYCEHCGEIQTIKTKVSEVNKFKTNNFPIEIEEILYKDIELKTDLDKNVKEIIEKEDYDGLTTDYDIEIALHLEFKDKKMSPIEILDYMDSLPINALDEILLQYLNNSSKHDMEIVKVCNKCSRESLYKTTEIPGLYQSLIS